MVNESLFLNANKMVEIGRSWNLANDVDLLKFLEKLSEKIVNNASDTLSSMDNLEDSLNETFLRVRTVANKFQAIADNQFIENRVQEEDDFVLAKGSKTESPKVSISSDGLRKQLFESIKDCQYSLSEKFETVQISGVDSEDEMAMTSPVVLVPKDAYKERRLPHLIGGSKFNADETLGLVPTEDLIENSIESEEEVDEPDRSSYSSFSAQGDDQVSPRFSQQFPPIALEKEVYPRDSPAKNTGSTTSSEKQSEATDLFQNVSRVENVTDVVENPQNQESLPSDDHTPLENPFPTPNLPKSNDAGTLREQLLAGEKFTSFKEDLAKVLGRSTAFKKQSANGFKSDVTSPSSKPDETCSQICSPESRTSTPSSADASRTPSLAKSEAGNIGSLTLPSVPTDVLDNLAKGRAKVKNKRRLPTRKHRQANVPDETPSSNAVGSSTVKPNSEDTSTHDSISTQPGSNILSPATDEEDLFVLPAFDLPTDPPHGNVFFGNSLLSPGTAIDDGLPNSPLFPVHNTIVENTEVSHALFNDASSTGYEPQKLNFNHFMEQPPPLESSENENVPKPLVQSKLLDTLFDEFEDSSNIFSSPTPEKTMAKVDNIFSSSPPLFSDWSAPVFVDQHQEKSSVKTKIRNNLTWDLLESDDLSEDLFRTHKKEVPSISSVKPEHLLSDGTAKVATEDIFTPSSSSSVDSAVKKSIFSDASSAPSVVGTLFEGGSSSPVDIFSSSKPFIGLGLKKSNNYSLFASDDDEDDDDSLFKSSGSSMNALNQNASKSKETTSDVKEEKRSSAFKLPTKEAIVDPLMSLEQSE